MNRIRFAPLRYKVACYTGWQWRKGWAIDLPGHPRLRFCCHRMDGWWCIDSYDTGFRLAAVHTKHSRKLLTVKLRAYVPALLAGGRYMKRVRAAARWIRRARALGEVKA